MAQLPPTLSQNLLSQDANQMNTLSMTCVGSAIPNASVATATVMRRAWSVAMPKMAAAVSMCARSHGRSVVATVANGVLDDVQGNTKVLS